MLSHAGLCYCVNVFVAIQRDTRKERQKRQRWSRGFLFFLAGFFPYAIILFNMSHDFVFQWA